MTNQNYIYCDGSTLNNGQPGVKKSGIGAVLICGGERHTISRAVDGEDNHRVEAKAVALSLIRALILAPEIVAQPTVLYTDSLHFADLWDAGGDSGYLWSTIREVAGMFTDLTMTCIAGEEVKGQHPLHAEADMLARAGANRTSHTMTVRKLSPLPPLALRGEYTFRYCIGASGKQSRDVKAKNMRHAWAIAALQVPKEAEWVVLERKR